ncbi:MAG: S41 family peptidase, partial [Bacteroidales bacterium]|nr:S41 family peptidase [Bacteroidales bacterium]
HGLYSDTPEWQARKKEFLAAADTVSDLGWANYLVYQAAQVAGGKHSGLGAPERDTVNYPEFAPEARMLEGGIAYVKLPAHSGAQVSDSLYAYSVLHFLQENSSAAGVVIDLRDNYGGNMYPMISAVSPLLPDGEILQFKGKKRTTPVMLDFVLRVVGIEASEIRKFPEGTPVAILTDDATASSGEATLLCFRGLDNTRTFGSPTAGYASANRPFPLKNGYSLILTTGRDVARTGEVFCDDPIAPDVETETPLEDAISWIQATRN